MPSPRRPEKTECSAVAMGIYRQLICPGSWHGPGLNPPLYTNSWHKPVPMAVGQERGPLVPVRGWTRDRGVAFSLGSSHKPGPMGASVPVRAPRGPAGPQGAVVPVRLDPFVPVPDTNRDQWASLLAHIHWFRFVAGTRTKGHPLVSVQATIRDQWW